MNFQRTTVTAALAVAVFGTGCATTGSQDQLSSAVYQNNRMLRDMQRDLNETVGSLDATVRRLDERNEENERLLREVTGASTETRHHLDQLSRQFEEFQRVAYREWGVRAPGASWTPPRQQDTGDIGVGPITFEDEGDEGGMSPLTPGGREEAAPASDPMTLYRQGQDAFIDERYQEALQTYDEVLRRHANWEHAHNAQFWKAESLFQLDNFPEAVREYERLRSEFPNSSKVPYSLYNQAIAHLRLGQRSEARELLEQIIDRFQMHETAPQAEEALRRL